MRKHLHWLLLTGIAILTAAISHFFSAVLSNPDILS
ncbi:hypothetical protein CLV51_109116 [Chitinophaga niastensis]|uniref:Uncharacterized protein n=1 Tax=Chitinophaga niastensis TaxID=536980 RepID=A0A2P8HA80_CHINA|nr:hypothetical protein CLV51_109116 [Chitinophaga niastensis]